MARGPPIRLEASVAGLISRVDRKKNGNCRCRKMVSDGVRHSLVDAGNYINANQPVTATLIALST